MPMTLKPGSLCHYNGESVFLYFVTYLLREYGGKIDEKFVRFPVNERTSRDAIHLVDTE